METMSSFLEVDFPTIQLTLPRYKLPSNSLNRSSPSTMCSPVYLSMYGLADAISIKVTLNFYSLLFLAQVDSYYVFIFTIIFEG